MRGADRLAAQFDALGLGVGFAARYAFENAVAIQLRRDAKNGKHDLGKVRPGVEAGLGKRTDAGAGALHIAGDHQKVGCVAREPVNGPELSPRRWGKPFHELPELRPVGRRAGPQVVGLMIGIARAPTLLSRRLSAWCEFGQSAVALSAGGAATGIFIAAALVQGLAICAFLLGRSRRRRPILVTMSKSSARAER